MNITEPVQCQIIKSDKGYEGVIIDTTGQTIFNSGFQGCAEDADNEMALMILRHGWKVIPGQ